MATPSITIPVDHETAKAFSQASTEEQRKLQLLLSLRLRELVSRPGKPLRALMDEIGIQAQARGLTPEVLDSILHDQ